MNHIGHVQAQKYDIEVLGGLGTMGYIRSNIFIPEYQLEIAPDGRVRRTLNVQHQLTSMARSRAQDLTSEKIKHGKSRWFPFCCLKRRLSSKEIEAVTVQGMIEEDRANGMAKQIIQIPREYVEKIDQLFKNHDPKDPMKSSDPKSELGEYVRGLGLFSKEEARREFI